MCELLAISASAPVNIKLSLCELARHGGETGIHSDGWGTQHFSTGATYGSPRARCIGVFAMGPLLQRHTNQSSTMIAHIRHATRGADSLANTQPFVRELGGRVHVFAHNGHSGEAIPADALSGQCYQPIGETDSEAAFCHLMQRFAARREQTTSKRSGIFQRLRAK